MRLYGDALNSVRGQSFKEISEISEFLETIYGSAKTFHDLEGELARVKQKGNESVLVYLNRKRVNIVNQDIEQITCAYCKRVGHGAVNCIILARCYGQQRPNQNNFNGQSGFNLNNFNGQSGLNPNNFNGQNRSGQNNGQNNGQNISSRNFLGNGNNSRNFANNRDIINLFI